MNHDEILQAANRAVTIDDWFRAVAVQAANDTAFETGCWLNGVFRRAKTRKHEENSDGH